MVNNVPNSWEYSDELEMLFLFYQCSEELLSESSPDTYALPYHNSMSLIYEIDYTYKLLDSYQLIGKYYSSYIPLVIDEFLQSLGNDYILKSALGFRLDSIKTGLREAKENPVLLQRWIDLFSQTCSMEQYIKLCSSEITRLITQTRNKKDLLYCTRNFFVCMIRSGYSREYLYQLVKRYFDNSSMRVTSNTQISDFLSQLDCLTKEFEFLVLMDVDEIEYYESIDMQLHFFSRIVRMDVKELRKELSRDYKVAELLTTYDKRKNQSRDHQKLEIVKYTAKAADPYSAIERLQELIKSIQYLSRYFKHYTPAKQVYDVLLKKVDGSYSGIQIPTTLSKRPYIDQKAIDLRITLILLSHSMSESTYRSLRNAIQMHAEALDSKNKITLFRNFWVALETLFSNPVDDENKENVINSTICIIQKTYILKLLRTVYFQICSAIHKEALEAINIATFEEFILFFAGNTEDSLEMKELYSLLSQNPLLRSRLFDLRKSLASGRKVSELLSCHSQKIEWQLRRIYRARNIATHIGKELPYIHILINHLLNYFDFVINYVLCKSENDNYISNITTLVFEAKCDNSLHFEMLKKIDALSRDNYIPCLFGPDINLIKYSFEFFK